ncbi:cytochrome P450 alkane hydroxylase, putative [Talaromyces stipitatus ATCC 10500]|uniref:Cytochrome P450 alkane hydroxylase, putative n=1 Tax=Talaromyces stipitatus (strain ATCC 10500 / CBS 375.48 / QM 6759 / NRRL 1006) TaxID=441959 RepID=B8ME14_TALSN|nr:cytochrome P450 alkane hydroxylase, putative [Talaromyces stipitatus ATCC 10500]EED16091.1 cytochrome P450 alkane hydroxylase, putative [Talaromyces stipitatus ATCC 10500]
MTIPPWQLFLGFIATSIAYSILSSIYKNIKNRRNAAARRCQPPNKIPTGLLGISRYREIIKYASEYRSLDLMEKTHHEGGNTFEQVVLGTKTIVTIEPDNIKALLATQFNDFGLGRRRNVFSPFLGDGIFTLDDAGWSHSRAMLRPQFSRDQVADVGMLGDHVNQLISLMPGDGTPFDIQEYFFRLTLDTATEFLFGESTNCLLENQNVQKKSALSSIGGEQGFAYAFNRSQDYVVQRARAQDLYWLVTSAEDRRNCKLVHNVVDHYVDTALARYNSAGGDQEKFIGSPNSDRYVFLNAMVRETQDRRALRDQMLNILLAGRDTTASLLSSSFYYLARHPRIWQRLREEILAKFPPTESAESITIARLREVKYLKYFLNETLRLLPPVPVNGRFAKHDTTIPVGGGPDGKSPVFVPKGVEVLYQVTLMHRRKDLWGEDAEEFRPERWEENGRHGWEYLPFNGGPRICLGQQYALTEASYVLVRLLQRFDHVVNEQPEITRPAMKFSLTASHAYGVKVGLYAA